MDNVSNTTSPAPVLPASRVSKYKPFFSLIRFVGAVLILVFIISRYFIHSYQVSGQSMFPTLNDGDRLIISKMGVTFDELRRKPYTPKRGDIIVFQDPFVDTRQLIKRVIALPGEKVTLEDGKLLVYNHEHPEGFNPDESFGQNFVFTVGSVDITVPDNQVFVVGDNRGPSGSLDSRNELGTVQTNLIIGKLFIRLFPITDIKVF